MKWIWVFAMGGVGALARMALAGLFPVRLLPWGTLLVNVIGCLVIGILFAIFEEERVLPPEWRVAIVGGFLGGFTTFSAFGLDLFVLTQSGQWTTAGLYAFASLVLGFVAVAAGVFGTHAVLARL
ncbi:MAG: fluoride efflux transporter CrcB [Myxococcota bacterium]